MTDILTGFLIGSVIGAIIGTVVSRLILEEWALHDGDVLIGIGISALSVGTASGLAVGIAG